MAICVDGTVYMEYTMTKSADLKNIISLTFPVTVFKRIYIYIKIIKWSLIEHNKDDSRIEKR